MSRLTLKDFESLKGSKKSYPVLVGQNMGNRTLSFNLNLREFTQISRVRNVAGGESKDSTAQRELDINHTKKLAMHILTGLFETQLKIYRSNNQKISKAISSLQDDVGSSPYAVLQPFVCNIQNCKRDGEDLEFEYLVEGEPNWCKVKIGTDQPMSVVDGQHRREAFNLVQKWLNEVLEKGKYPAASFIALNDPNSKTERISYEVLDFWKDVADIAWSSSCVSIECHLGLDTEEERQLFADLNNKGKKVEISMAVEFDKSNPLNKFISEELIEEGVIKNAPVSKDTSTWHKDNGSLLRKDIGPITSLALFGKASSRSLTPSMVNEQKPFAINFWETIHAIKDYGTTGSRGKTVASQPVVLKGIARLFFELAFSKTDKNEEDLAILINKIKTGKLDFSHKNDLWRALFLSSSERKDKYAGIEMYVHVPAGTNLDAGTFDSTNNWVRFGSKHNDIYPRIGDLIRYSLGFRPRVSVTRSIEAGK